ncbi:MAG TPA: hypothetical protein VGM27_27180 [Acidobacteriaceae bacterium]|jgi:hypothetical protein
MKSRYLFLAGGAVFLVVAAVELFHVKNYLAAVINAVTGTIFLYLSGIKPKFRP